MTRTLIATAALVGAATLSVGAFAQATTNPAPTGTQGTLDRDIHQQQRIEQGLQNGTITTRENAELQRDEARVDRLQARDMRNGSLSAAEQSRLAAAQDRLSADIHDAKRNGVDGNPLSASSQRAQAEVQRNLNQQQRIETGVHNGTLTAHEASRLEHGQANDGRREYAVGRDGRIGAWQQRGLQAQETRQSGRIYAQKHDQQHRH